MKKYIFALFFLSNFLFSDEEVNFWSEQLQTKKTTQSVHSDDPDTRLYSRLVFSEDWLRKNNTKQAAVIINEYGSPVPVNLEWPFVLGYIQAARISAFEGETFDALRRLQVAVKKSNGLGRIHALRALSEIVETEAELVKALGFEKEALKTGKSWFKRRRISESAGLEDAKEGSEIWVKLKPVIEARIEDLERRVDIDRYGLDYVLYREAQALRKASHPAALDFTDIAAAFRMRNERLAPSIPGADFEAARKQYLEITQLFPEGVYTEASHLYAAVCLAHQGDIRGAMQELTSFYKRDPEGLYRGEALLLLGDMYLVGQWDRLNAREAYSRASTWAATVGERKRILDTYAVPEKSAKVSKPPERPRNLDQYGQIQQKALHSGVLLNRMTADWYLPRVRAKAKWKLGFLAAVAKEKEDAKQHFDSALAQDKLLQRAVGMRAFNKHDRLVMGLENGVFIGREEEMAKLTDKVRLAMSWADFQFMIENFDLAKDLYRRIQSAASEERKPAALVRATVGEIMVRKAEEDPDVGIETPRLFDMVMEYPKAPASPWLLWNCATITRGDPMRYPEIYDLIIKKYPRSRWALEVRYNQVIKHPWKYHEERRAMMEQFKRDYPNETEYHMYLENWDKSVKQYLSERAERRAREAAAEQ